MKKIVVALMAVLFAFGTMSMTGCKVKKKKFKGGGKGGFCKDMANRYTKCMTGDKKGFSKGDRGRLARECKKNKHTRKALEKCWKHEECDKFLSCLTEKL